MELRVRRVATRFSASCDGLQFDKEHHIHLITIGVLEMVLLLKAWDL
jgi:hypothetical protein